MPLIVKYSDEDDDELREYCLQAFESFVYRCPKEITPHINKVRIIRMHFIYLAHIRIVESARVTAKRKKNLGFQIINICLKYITYDPNYNYDDDMNDLSDGEGVVMEVEEDGEEDAEDEYSDDDDMSWKVRRAAAKCLEAVVSSRRELLPDLYRVVSPALIARFKGKYIDLRNLFPN